MDVSYQLKHIIMHATTTPIVLVAQAGLAAALLLLVIFPLVLLLPLQRHRGTGSSNDDANKQQASNKSKKNLNITPPPSPPGLPIIGHLHLIGDHPQVSLRDLAAEHGDGGLLLLRLGAVPTLVASSPRAARAILRTHDHVFASRPTSTVSDALLYGSSDIGFGPYGEHWRQLRKLVTAHLFTVKKVRSYRRAREEEVRLVMANIRSHMHHHHRDEVIDMSELLNAFANDIVCRAVSGKFFRAEGRNRLFRELIDVNSRLVGGFSLLEDYFPGLARSSLTSWFVRRKVQQAHERWDQLLENIITDHEIIRIRPPRSSLSDAAAADDDDEQQVLETDFIDVLLSVQQEYGITRDHIKALLMDMFAAGTDTSSLILELAMRELMRNPHLMTKLQAEVRSNTPEGQETVAEENLGPMAYLRAVVKETLRLHPPAPLLIPRLSMADCHLIEHDTGGYTVPSGIRVIVNAWAINRDPEAWEEKPEEFVPERFMEEGGSAAGVDFRGTDFQFLPFGAGRRICPGLNFGLATVEIMLANLVYCFDWSLPDGMNKEDVDMTEVFGLTVRPKEKLLLVPREPPPR